MTYHLRSYALSHQMPGWYVLRVGRWLRCVSIENTLQWTKHFDCPLRAR